MISTTIGLKGVHYIFRHTHLAARPPSWMGLTEDWARQTLHFQSHATPMDLQGF